MKLAKKSWKLIALGFLTSFLLTVVFLNLRPHQVRLDQKVTISYSVSDPQFSHMMSHLLSTPVVPGNSVTDFQNGSEIFPAMLSAIESAKKSVTFESYIYWSGAVGERFLKALIERAQQGVKVHILIDWVGSQKIDPEYIKKLRTVGAEVEYYHPLHWYNIFRMNNRTHRKILVVDGHTSFTGGVGISDDWDGNGDNSEKWRDSHYRITGPVALYFQTAFMDNWLKTRPEVLHDEIYFPKVATAGDVKAQVFISSPREGGASMRLMYLLTIAAAKKSLRIASAYFVPDDITINELIEAKQRGVEIQIIVPGKYTDSDVVKNASRATWGKLLKAGIQIYEFQPAKYHMKILIADDYFVSVGSTNFDDRSFRLNNEFNLNIYDAQFASQQLAIFKKDLSVTRPVTYEQWLDRPAYQKITESLSTIIQNQL